MAQIFFGLWLLPLGYLVYRSGWSPRVLGILLMFVGCTGYLVDLTTRLVAPNLGATLGPFVTTPAALVEFAMILWLLINRFESPVSGSLNPPGRRAPGSTWPPV